VNGAGASAGNGLAFRCAAAARWLPRVLAASVLVAALLAARRIAPAAAAVGGFAWIGPLVVVVGAWFGLWIVRGGSEVWRVIRVTDEMLQFELGRHRTRLPLDQIQALSWQPPLAVRGRWLPAAAAIDSEGLEYRIPALLSNGSDAIRELLRCSGRRDLATWAETLALERRMGRAAGLTIAGYAGSAAVLSAGFAFFLR